MLPVAAMRFCCWLSLALLIATGCAASDPNATTITSAQLVGTWNGTASNGKSSRYTFGADGSFQFGPVEGGTFAPVASGTFAIQDRHQLALDGEVADESGALHHVITTTDAYVRGNTFCDSALYASEAYGSFVGDWSTTSQWTEVDTNGVPTGAGTTSTTTLEFDGNGFVLQLTDGQQTGGSYTKNGDQVTVSMSNGSVTAVQSFTLVDDAVLCDPAYGR